MKQQISLRHLIRLCMLVGAYAFVAFAVPAQELPGDSVVTSVSSAQTIQPDASAASKPFFMTVKTNMLYDAAAVPNIGAEVYVGRNFSVSAQWMYAWWSNDKRHRYWRIYGGDVNARYWFGQASRHKPLTGHHAGIYFGALTFDFEWGGTAYMGGRPGHGLWDRCIINAGIEYGYSLPVGRHFNIDFTLGVGYAGGIIEKFHPENGLYVWDSTKRKMWIGPTKAEVSLVWLLGRGNVNSGKGGVR